MAWKEFPQRFKYSPAWVRGVYIMTMAVVAVTTASIFTSWYTYELYLLDNEFSFDLYLLEFEVCLVLDGSDDCETHDNWGKWADAGEAAFSFSVIALIFYLTALLYLTLHFADNLPVRLKSFQMRRWVLPILLVSGSVSLLLTWASYILIIELSMNSDENGDDGSGDYTSTRYEDEEYYLGTVFIIFAHFVSIGCVYFSRYGLEDPDLFKMSSFRAFTGPQADANVGNPFAVQDERTPLAPVPEVKSEEASTTTDGYSGGLAGGRTDYFVAGGAAPMAADATTSLDDNTYYIMDGIPLATIISISLATVLLCDLILPWLYGPGNDGLQDIQLFLFSYRVCRLEGYFCTDDTLFSDTDMASAGAAAFVFTVLALLTSLAAAGTQMAHLLQYRQFRKRTFMILQGTTGLFSMVAWMTYWGVAHSTDDEEKYEAEEHIVVDEWDYDSGFLVSVLCSMVSLVGLYLVWSRYRSDVIFES